MISFAITPYCMQYNDDDDDADINLMHFSLNKPYVYTEDKLY